MWPKQIRRRRWRRPTGGVEGGEGGLDRGLLLLVGPAVVGRERRGLAPHGPHKGMVELREPHLPRRFGLAHGANDRRQRQRQLGLGSADSIQDSDRELQRSLRAE